MAHGHPISRLGRWEGYIVTEDWTQVRAGESVYVVRFEPWRLEFGRGPVDLDGIEAIGP